MSKKSADIVEIGDLWIYASEVDRVAKELGVSPDCLVTDHKLSTKIDTELLMYFFNNKGKILDQIKYNGVDYVYGKVSVTYSGAPFKIYKRIFFRRS